LYINVDCQGEIFATADVNVSSHILFFVGKNKN